MTAEELRDLPTPTIVEWAEGAEWTARMYQEQAPEAITTEELQFVDRCHDRMRLFQAELRRRGNAAIGHWGVQRILNWRIPA